VKTISLLILLAATTFAAPKPEDGPYSPTMSADFRRKGELYPAALGIRPWKTEKPADYSGHFVDADSQSTIDLQVITRGAENRGEWLVHGSWKMDQDAQAPRAITWAGASLELESKHAYAYAARGCLFLFFVQYRDPDRESGDLRPAVLVGDRLFVRE
jgi:hypothetical protein